MRTAILLIASTSLLLSQPASGQSPTPQSAAIPSSGLPILIHRVEPKLPPEAARENISGIVTARLTIDAQGRVTNVDVVHARPRRVFERSVIEALSQWRYNEGAAGRSIESEITFNVTPH
jgi:protein TonB